MSLRARIFIVISIIVALVLAVSIFLLVRSRQKNTQTPQSTNTTQTPDNSSTVLPGVQTQTPTEIPAGLPAKVPTTQEIEQNGVRQLAKIFIERYGTYSTDNESQNIIEVQPLVTKSLWSKISAGIQTKTTNQPFVGLTTKVVTATLADWSASKAIVNLKTSRTESKDSAITTRNQNVTVEMVKENGVWLANSIVWN